MFWFTRNLCAIFSVVFCNQDTHFVVSISLVLCCLLLKGFMNHLYNLYNAKIISRSLLYITVLESISQEKALIRKKQQYNLKFGSLILPPL